MGQQEPFIGFNPVASETAAVIHQMTDAIMGWIMALGCQIYPPPGGRLVNANGISEPTSPDLVAGGGEKAGHAYKANAATFRIKNKMIGALLNEVS